MDLPGRPAGNADGLRAGARAWRHLAWEVWHLSQPVQQHVGALLDGWSGQAADEHRAKWEQVRRGLAELDHRLNGTGDHLLVLAGQVEDAQTAYDHMLGAAGLVAAAGIGFAVVTGGLSGVAAGEAEGALGLSLTGLIDGLQAAIARMGVLIGESAQSLGMLSPRLAMEFSIRAPELAVGGAGGAVLGAATTVAAGDWDLHDIALNSIVGAVAGGGVTRPWGEVLTGPPELVVMERAEVEGFEVERAVALAKDPARGGKVAPSGPDEAIVGLRLERAGRLRSLVRSEDPQAEFIEDGGAGRKWDVKSFRSTVDDRPQFVLDDAIDSIERKLIKGVDVIVNTAYLSKADLGVLRSAIEEHGWSAHVLFGESS